MSYIIGSKCVSVCDTACVGVCPVDCIYGPIDKIDTGTEVESLKEDKNYLYDKLEKAYGDRVKLRAENARLKNPKPVVEEEECLACSA